ncbi:MAG: tripartite tricarboxylate transporter substrate binding protein [Reyranella sp.]|nr:tripartite tricarboxylate transporter substrate binding protein [Reyranella sp.]
MLSLSKRRLLAYSLLTVPLARTAIAQTWPDRPIRIVVPFPAGAGVLDIMARLLAAHLGPAFGQPNVIDNRPGAGGTIGADVVAKAPADGYTMLMGNPSLVVNPFLLAKMPYDPMTDFIPLTLVNTAPLLLVAHPSVPANSVAELIALARSKPGQLNYGSGGVGSTPFLATELFRSMANIDVTHVPYRGGAPALADLVGGQLSFMIENMPGTLPFVKSGKLKALGVTTDHRAALAPDIPTIAESGLPGYEVVGWNGLFLVKDTPPAIAGKLYDEVAKALRSTDVKDQMAALGAEPGGNTPAEFTAFVRAESVRWGKIIQDKGIKPE